MMRASFILLVALTFGVSPSAQSHDEAESHIAITQPAPGTVSPWWAGAVLTAKVEHDASQVAFIVDGVELNVDKEPPFTYTWRPAEVGVHDLKAVATSPDGSVIEATSTFRVTGGGFLDLKLPSPYEIFQAGETIPLEVEATDPAGYIPAVEFYANDVKIGGIDGIPIDPAPGTPLVHSFEWNNPPVGLHRLETRAMDESGKKVRSFVRWVYAGVPRPEAAIAIDSPAEGDYFNRSEPITIKASAVDPFGGVLSVEFFANGKLIGSQGIDIAAAWIEPGQRWTYSFTLVNGIAETGAHQLTALYRRADGSELTSAPVEIVIADRENDNKEALTFLKPTDRIYLDGDSFPIQLHGVTGQGGFIPDADVFLDGNRIGFASYCPPNAFCPIQDDPVLTFYGKVPSDLAPGVYTLTARALVNNREIESAALKVALIDRRSVPSFQINEPEEGAIYVSPAPLSFNVTTIVPDGFVETLEVLANGEVIGILGYCLLDGICEAPDPGQRLELFQFLPSEASWPNLTAGHYAITVRGMVAGTDRSVESEPVNITVLASAPAAPSLTFLTREGSVFGPADRIPLELESLLPSGHLSHVDVFANGERIGFASECAPNADCWGRPSGQRNIRLTFYQTGGPIEDWGYWTGMAAGEYVITASGQANDEFIESEPLNILVSDPPPPSATPFLSIISEAGGHLTLQLTARGKPSNYTLETSVNLKDWLPAGSFSEEGTAPVARPNELLPVERFYRARNVSQN